ncbi:YfjI family protein [Streptomyces sp. H39-S7]|uniref:YfjI family protein n=1 Tax=Streptomyces sp. H39-S7 TaxID=3004357 RepID=UPI0022B03F3A|nr:YfjI family protein [Streptomyces sp. H39-S7]MCZ4123901.1 YfjI family protein [Streptomyces sp. H39-S7]
MSTPSESLPDLWDAPLSDPDEPAPQVWDNPVPLTGHHQLRAFPTHALPGWLREFTEAVAEETQTPIDLAGCIALAVLATAAGGRAVVNVRGNWREPTNLFVVVALPPANRKSAVFDLLSDPLYEAEKQLQAATKPLIAEAQLTVDLAREAAKEAAVLARGDGSRDELVATAVAMAQSADTLKVPVLPQLLADDATAETVITRMAEQEGRISVMSAEGEIFDIIAGRYTGGAPNMGPFLKGHAGDRLRVDRQTRREYIDHPALTMGLCVQPQVLDDIGRIKGGRGRGLLGRFLYSLPESLVGRRVSNPAPIPADVRATYTRRVIALTLSLADWTDPAVLQPTSDADAALLAFQDLVEPKLAARGGAFGHISDWAGKLVGAVARIAGLLHLAEHPDNAHTIPITVTTMEAAIEVGQYFATHALAVFDRMGADPTVARARTVLDVLKTAEVGEISKRDLLVKLSRSEFTTVADLEPVLGLLEDHGWVRSLPVARTGGRGRPPSPRYLVHPRVHDPAA